VSHCQPQLDELADALPLRQPQEAQLRSVEDRRAELADSGAGLEAQLAEAGALHCCLPTNLIELLLTAARYAETALSAVRQTLRVASDAIFREEGSMRTS
jgi:hypothetical protein